MDLQIARREFDVWLTRGRTQGILDRTIEIWWTRPDRFEGTDEDVTYVGLLDDGGTSLFGRWTVGQCQREFNTYPEDSRQVIFVGGKSRAVPPSAPRDDDLDIEVED